MNIVKMQETIQRLKSGAANVREHAKAITHEVVGTVIGGATSAGIGAYDQAKGTVESGDPSNTSFAKVGPVPVALGVAALGKAAALAMRGDGESHAASAFGQAGVDCWAYVRGRIGWAKHKAANP